VVAVNREHWDRDIDILVFVIDVIERPAKLKNVSQSWIMELASGIFLRTLGRSRWRR
jgi:hypothetical protein